VRGAASNGRSYRDHLYKESACNRLSSGRIGQEFAKLLHKKTKGIFSYDRLTT